MAIAMIAGVIVPVHRGVGGAVLTDYVGVQPLPSCHVRRSAAMGEAAASATRHPQPRGVIERLPIHCRMRGWQRDGTHNDGDDSEQQRGGEGEPSCPPGELRVVDQKRQRDDQTQRRDEGRDEGDGQKGRHGRAAGVPRHHVQQDTFPHHPKEVPAQASRHQGLDEEEDIQQLRGGGADERQDGVLIALPSDAQRSRGQHRQRRQSHRGRHDDVHAAGGHADSAHDVGHQEEGEPQAHAAGCAHETQHRRHGILPQHHPHGRIHHGHRRTERTDTQAQGEKETERGG
mmetsp:Transcript_35205/g.101265  ORF Transcript_35205/g.101265 Transcript_35205/m.101265 type:complete len:287 (-) Transcript_35205:128-988(-)